MRFLLGILIVVAVGLSTALTIIIQQSSVSTLDLDQDLAAIKQQIVDANAETAEYSGGAIKALIELRTEVLRSTMAMLTQKRMSLVRYILLKYTLDGREVTEAPDTELDDILKELSQAEQVAAASKRNAAQYTGGLLQGISLVTAATNELNVAQLRMKFYTAKYGIPLPRLGDPNASTQGSPGTIAKDREAL